MGPLDGSVVERLVGLKVGHVDGFADGKLVGCPLGEVGFNDMVG